jgi:glycine/D-amino acid oxidase-like deaminating enzyme
MKSTEYLIIGQGLCGTFLAWELEKAGRSFIIVDDARPFAASRVASGIINPVTGRRIVKTWMIDELLPFALDSYRQVESSFGIHCIAQKNVVDFFPTFQMKDAFMKRIEERPDYLSFPASETEWHNILNFDFGYGEIDPCYLVDVGAVLSEFRKKWKTSGQLIEQHIPAEELNEVALGEIAGFRFQKAIFCDGIGAADHPLFRNLPFAPNKGEALIVEIADFPVHHIIKKGFMIVPWKDGLFWVGSSHEWNFTSKEPTALFYERTEAFLRHFLKVPFRIVDHFAAVRPATLERRPFVGMHPVETNIGILNGMGTKGCSLAPYFAKQFAGHLVNKSDLLPEVDIARFKGVLSRRLF